MNESLREFGAKISDYWRSVDKKKKFLFIGIFLLVVISLASLIYFVSKPNYVPLYTNELSQKEIGDIKAELDRQGYTEYKLENNGTEIIVPQEDASDLLVSLAAKGLPKTGAISFSDMTKELKFGATDRQLDAMQREALQGQVASLLTHMDGVKNAEVIISLPEESLFVRPDDKKQASASVVIELEPAYTLEPKQIQALYHLVSKSIPNLPKENIVITDQYGQLLEVAGGTGETVNTGDYANQRKIQQDVEKDIQQSLQQMLGTLMGRDKVFIQTFVRLNFDQVKTKEDLVEPVNEDTNEGIIISSEKISKTYSGKNDPAGGVSGTGQTDVSQYPSANSSSESQSEDIQNRVNYEVNRITREIVQSPYQIEDLTINVGVEPPDPKDPASLTPETIESIEQVVGNVVRTAMSGNQNNPNLTDQDINSRITVFPREFNGKAQIVKTDTNKSTTLPWWAYALIGLGVALISFLVFLLLRQKKQRAQFDNFSSPSLVEEPEQIAPEPKLDRKDAMKKQLEQLAIEQPDEFVGLLRNWLAKD